MYCTFILVQTVATLQNFPSAPELQWLNWGSGSIPLTGPVLRDFVPYMGILVNHPVKAPYYGNFGKTVPKMLQIRSFCGILQFSPQKCPKFYLFFP